MGEHQRDPYSPPSRVDQRKMPSALAVALVGILSLAAGVSAFYATCYGLAILGSFMPGIISVVFVVLCIALPIPTGLYVARSVRRRMTTGQWRKKLDPEVVE